MYISTIGTNNCNTDCTVQKFTILVVCPDYKDKRFDEDAISIGEDDDLNAATVVEDKKHRCKHLKEIEAWSGSHSGIFGPSLP